jgi:hypothetical protein
MPPLTYVPEVFARRRSNSLAKDAARRRAASTLSDAGKKANGSAREKGVGRATPIK